MICRIDRRRICPLHPPQTFLRRVSRHGPCEIGNREDTSLKRFLRNCYGSLNLLFVLLEVVPIQLIRPLEVHVAFAAFEHGVIQWGLERNKLEYNKKKNQKK